MLTVPGTYTLGPNDGTLTVRTGKSGAAAKAGHNLLIEVTAWQATLELGEDPGQTSVVLSADSASFAVREGTGGIQALDDDDKAGIKQTIDDEILRGTAVAFRSSQVVPNAGGDGMTVQGELELAGRTHPVEFDLTVTEAGQITGSATINQSDFAIKPYSALFGTLKVADAVEVTVDATLRMTS